MSEKPNPLRWREHCAVTHMHLQMAASKFQSVSAKDSKDIQGTMSNLEKAIESIEAAHEAAMSAHAEYKALFRYHSQFKGVRLNAITAPDPRVPLTASISELVKK